LAWKGRNRTKKGGGKQSYSGNISKDLSGYGKKGKYALPQFGAMGDVLYWKKEELGALGDLYNLYVWRIEAGNLNVKNLLK